MLKNNEIWKPAKKFEKYYAVSNLGRIKSLRKNKIMCGFINNSGYYCIDFKVQGKRYKKLVHRIILETFVNNKNNLPEVNHIDEDKLNNKLTNLEWCTSSYNKQHSMKSGAYDRIFTLNNTLGKKHLPNAKSKYFNVGWDKARNKWTACVRHNKKNLERKRFKTEIEAAIHVNYILNKYNLTDRPKNII